MANGVVCSNSGTELILIWTDISHGIKSLAAIYSDSFMVYMCVRCIFYVRMYLNWELRQEDEIVYALRIIVLNYDGTYLLWFAWRCYFTVYWARCACMCECLCVCVHRISPCILANDIIHRLQYSTYNATYNWCGFFLSFFGFPKTFICILFVHADDYEWQAHTHTPQSRSESYKTYNFNLIWPKKGKSGKQNFQRNANRTHKIFYEFFFESQQIQNTTFALHPHIRTNMMNTQIHNRYCSVYKSTGVWRTHVLPKWNAECKRNEKNMNANRIHRRPKTKLHNTHVLIRSGVPALLLYDCARYIWSNRQIPHVCCCFLLLLLLMRFFFHSILFTANSLGFFAM